MRDSKLVGLLVIVLIVLALAFIPIKILASGFFPRDDALRHSANAISGKDWNKVLILREPMLLDSHPGWDTALGFIHSITNWDKYSLVIFSVAFCFIAFCLVPVLFLRYPEVWPLTVAALILVNPATAQRLISGRPYILTMSALLVVGFIWPALGRARIPFRALIPLTGLLAVTTWFYGSWYLWIIPVFCFLSAREWRAAARLSFSIIAGILIGAALTGHPYIFLRQTLRHFYYVFSAFELPSMFVSELRPYNGDLAVVSVVALMILWRAIRRTGNPRLTRDPIFILALVSWALGFISRRVWFDWGIPAVALWMAKEFQEFFAARLGLLSWRRFFLSVLLIGVFYVGMTADFGHRWSEYKLKEYAFVESEAGSRWFPGPGGIIYSNDMRVFFQMFFNYPDAPWRYALGFEPGLMTREDRATLAAIRMSVLKRSAVLPLEPWISKMTPEDRLILTRMPGEPLPGSALEWHDAGYGTWIGRLPERQ